MFEESVQNSLGANMVSAWDADHVTKGTTWILNDKWGNNNGTFYDGTSTACSDTTCPQIVNDGQMGNVLSFDGVDDHIDINFHSSLDLINLDEFSLSIWIKTPGGDLLSKGGNSSTNGSYLIFYSTGASSFVFKGGPYRYYFGHKS